MGGAGPHVGTGLSGRDRRGYADRAGPSPPCTSGLGENEKDAVGSLLVKVNPIGAMKGDPSTLLYSMEAFTGPAGSIPYSVVWEKKTQDRCRASRHCHRPQSKTRHQGGTGRPFEVVIHPNSSVLKFA